MQLFGSVMLECVVQNKTYKVTFYITNNKTILGAADCERLGFVKWVHEVELAEPLIFC